MMQKENDYDQHPLLLRYTPKHKIRVSLVLRDISSRKCPPCDILVVSGNRHRTSPFWAVKEILIKQNQGDKLRLSFFENQQIDLIELDWPKIQVNSLDYESNRSTDLWKQLYWFKQDKNEETLNTAYYRLKNAIQKIDVSLTKPSDLCIPLIGTLSKTDIKERFAAMSSFLLELDHGNGLKNIKSILIYTYSSKTLDCLNRLMIEGGFSPCYDLLFEENDKPINQLNQIQVSHSVLQKCKSIIIENIEITYNYSKIYYQNQQNYKAATVTASSIQIIGLNIRLSIEEITKTILKSLMAPGVYKQFSNQKKSISAFIGEAKKLTKGTLPNLFWKIVKSLRIKGNLLQHSGSLWFIGEVDIYEYVKEYINLLKFFRDIPFFAQMNEKYMKKKEENLKKKFSKK